MTPPAGSTTPRARSRRIHPHGRRSWCRQAARDKCPRIFAAGDVRAGSTKRCAAAVGEGSMAVQLVHEHLAAANAPVGGASACSGRRLSAAEAIGLGTPWHRII